MDDPSNPFSQNSFDFGGYLVSLGLVEIISGLLVSDVILLELLIGCLPKEVFLLNCIAAEALIGPIPLLLVFKIDLLIFLWVEAANVVGIVSCVVAHGPLAIVSPLCPRHLAVAVVVEIFRLFFTRKRMWGVLGDSTLIILFLQLGVIQDIVSLIELLEEGLITLSLVGVILFGQDKEPLLYLLQTSILTHF